MKSRIFNIMQYELHPETNEPLLNETQINVALSHKTIKRWAYVAHDKDHYSDADFDSDPNKTPDKLKPKHWHIVLECSQQLESITIARWFGIKENYVDCPKGAGAFLDCVEYLTHENPKQVDLDKVKYEDREIVANFDFRSELDKRAERLLRYGKDLNEKDSLLMDVMVNGMTLKEAQKKAPLTFGNNYSLYSRARGIYLKAQPAPSLRLNFYVSSKKGGDGKGLVSRAIARSLFPGVDDEELFFCVNPDTKFNDYDGQPVLIWNDFRAYDLLKACGGRGAFFDLFDTHPVKQIRDVKYSTVALINQVNIVNSVQEYHEFLNGLAGEYEDKDGNVWKSEDKGQAYRRFPLIVEVRVDDYDFMINKGYLAGNKSYEEYEVHQRVKAGFRAINELLSDNDILRHELEAKALAPLIDVANGLREDKKKPLTEEEARRLFEGVGEYIKSSESIKGEDAVEEKRELSNEEVEEVLDEIFGKESRGKDTKE